jgi:hydroxymethylpyrimidine/phosphomethylpyrimidine kinase
MAPDSEDTVSIRTSATALTIAGSDPIGGAGLQADLKTFQQYGIYGMSAVTLITVQTTTGVMAVEVMRPELVVAQVNAVLDDVSPRVIKVGALGNAAVVEAVGNRLKDVDCAIVVDPVLVSKHGDSLAGDDVVDAYKEFLLPHATVVTPNRFEAEKLTGGSLDDEQNIVGALRDFHEIGTRMVLLKLGADGDERSHWMGDRDAAACSELRSPLLDAKNTHGSGCVLSAAIASAIAMGAPDLQQAVQFGIEQAFQAISIGCDYGKGIPPVDVRGLQAPD